MTVSVETLSGLERKITLSVPSAKIEEQVGVRLRDLAKKVKMDGFRPGKVPFHLVKSRYSDSLRAEIAYELIQPTLFEAMQAQDIAPAGMPNVEPGQVEPQKDFTFSATFEVFPEINVVELDKNAKLTLKQSEVKAKDVDAMIDKLREQTKVFEEVKREVKADDKVTIDFKGYIDDTPFDGGEAQDYVLHMGKGSMIPGFEDGIIGAQAGKPFDIEVTFPEDYGHDTLAGKKARFTITVKKIEAGVMPELNDEFAKQFNIKEGGVEALKKDIEQNMQRELKRRIDGMNRELIFDALLAANEFDVPKGLIRSEIDNLKHEMYHRIFGHEHHENEKIPDFPDVLFEEQAKKRVKLGLLFSEYVKKHALKADAKQTEAMIETLASAYEDPEELLSWYKSKPERMADIEALVLEELAAEKICESASVSHKKIGYDEIMNPKKDDESKGE